MATDQRVERAEAQVAALRRLTAYRAAAEDLPDAVREAARHGLELSAIADAAGISRGRVYRIIGTQQPA